MAYSLGDVSAILNTSRAILGPAVEDLFLFRLSKALKGVGAQDRAELGVLAHLLFISKKFEVLGNDYPCSKPVGTSTGVGMGLRFNLAWIDLVIAFPDVMMQKFGVAYTFLFPDISAKMVAEDPTIINVLRVAAKKATTPMRLVNRLSYLPRHNHFVPPVSMGKAINMFAEYWLSRSNSTFLVPPTNEVFPEIQFKRNARGTLPSPCSNESYFMIIKNLHEMAGGMSTHPTQAELSDGWSPWGYGDNRSGTLKPCMTKENVNPTLVVYLTTINPVMPP